MKQYFFIFLFCMVPTIVFGGNCVLQTPHGLTTSDHELYIADSNGQRSNKALVCGEKADDCSNGTMVFMRTKHWKGMSWGPYMNGHEAVYKCVVGGANNKWEEQNVPDIPGCPNKVEFNYSYDGYKLNNQSYYFYIDDNKCNNDFCVDGICKVETQKIGLVCSADHKNKYIYKKYLGRNYGNETLYFCNQNGKIEDKGAVWSFVEYRADWCTPSSGRNVDTNPGSGWNTFFGDKHYKIYKKSAVDEWFEFDYDNGKITNFCKGCEDTVAPKYILTKDGRCLPDNFYRSHVLCDWENGTWQPYVGRSNGPGSCTCPDKGGKKQYWNRWHETCEDASTIEQFCRTHVQHQSDEEIACCIDNTEGDWNGITCVCLDRSKTWKYVRGSKYGKCEPKTNKKTLKEQCDENHPTASPERLACCYAGNNTKWTGDETTGTCECKDTNTEWVYKSGDLKGKCEPKSDKACNELYTDEVAIFCCEAIKQGENAEWIDTDKKCKCLDTGKIFDKATKKCIDNVNNQMEEQRRQELIEKYKSSKENLSAFFESAKTSAWRTADGKFNTVRLVSDIGAGVVLGTVGGVVSGVVIKKKQIEKGFEVLKCRIGGQNIATWGDTFKVRLNK